MTSPCRTPLRGKIHAAQQVSESWVRAQVLEFRRALQFQQDRRVHLIGLLEPEECLILVVECSVNGRKFLRDLWVSSSRGLQLTHDCERFGAVAREREN